MEPSTGISSLDDALCRLRPGDNVVWQVHSIDDYRAVVEPFVASARNAGQRLTYFRFARHKELVPAGPGVRVVELRPEDGFENFITEIHDVIRGIGQGGYYVFDSLSELVLDCYSERMLGNFFMLTCPLLRRLDTIAYFAVLKDYHAYYAALPISTTTQLLLDVYRHEGRVYIHPLKADERFSPTMYTLHAWDGDNVVPITDSPSISNVVTSAPWPGLQSASYRMIGMWDRSFMQAEDILAAYEHGECSKDTVDNTFRRMLSRLISRDPQILALAEKYLTLRDLIHTWKRTIGSGLVGGKAAGLLLARAILKKNCDQWPELAEAHDSFFIGSDIFYSFLVENGCWDIRQKQKNPATFLEGAAEARERIRAGQFPDYVIRRFSDMLAYFGQSPIVVRSSSLLEDAFGNAFAGKYESVFCANQGTQEDRLAEFVNAVRTVYASTMSEGALAYRAQRGVLGRDEQMALLVQRVSGAPHGERFFPHVAGVGFSFNPYVWHESIDPLAGMVRLVFGLGTRAVDRHDDDYARLVALNAPERRLEVGLDDQRRYSQKHVDVLDLKENRFTSCRFGDAATDSPTLPMAMFASLDGNIQRRLRNGELSGVCPWVLTFEKMLRGTAFTEDMRDIIRILKEAYGEHVDVEFTANFLQDGRYRINIVQCRPFQIKNHTAGPVPTVSQCDVILEAHGAVIGQSRTLDIDRVVYVVPEAYGRLPLADRHTIARLIGKLSHAEAPDIGPATMLIGPGRWGASMPSLGVPISFPEINTVSVLCEIDAMHEHLRTDLSLGTHFFNDLVEMDMLYVGFRQANEKNTLNREFLSQSPNRLSELLPEALKWSEVIHVITPPAGCRIVLSAILSEQKAVLFLASDK